MTIFMNPLKVRQDHIFINRIINKKEQVTGANLAGHKIGGDINNAIVILPDPMGATGNSISAAVNTYKTTIAGKPKKIIALHLIITPEYLRKMKNEHPEVIVYALRLDRGLSSKEILETIPGQKWEQEKGLNEKQYIVPGAGGLGEIINNSFV
jgi:uracil phosphoribosyltransferase